MKSKNTRILLTAIVVLGGVCIFIAQDLHTKRSADVDVAPGTVMIQASPHRNKESKEASGAPAERRESAGYDVPAGRSDVDSLEVPKLFEQLASLSPGDAAIALGRRLGNAITPANTPQYVEALLSTDHPGVERAALTALSRTADSQTLIALVGRYGRTEPERRGRILQILENAANPVAFAGLTYVVDTDKSEKRSPLLVHALNGLANLGTAEATSYLIQQVATDNETFAYMALERVRDMQSREMIRSAAAGNKDSEGITPEQRQTLSRIADKPSAGNEG